MPRAGLTPAALVELSLSLVDSDGLGSLTLTKVAERAGVAVPALYKHVRNLSELNQLVAARVLEDMTHELAAVCVGRSGDDAVHALTMAFRHYARRHPQRALVLAQAPAPGTPAAEVAARMLDVFLAVLRGYGLHGPAAIHAARILRASCHGFVSIEAGHGFGLPEDADVTYRLMVRMLIQGLPIAADAG
ncbi:TetR/AcrR family transcriptional regulator [Catelliglobosispora koreensis]|uniref:TetR/AcrR family transcriptional regulator n=1 Tax=Catelliglobosispora koreensis TaxID=129052 RepID=UPI00037970CE|nr:TetR/AcrR family transcriptional regulator [Catelliglobosispora koreensis]